MELDFLSSIIKGDNNPPSGKNVFDSSDHVRFQNGKMSPDITTIVIVE